MIMFSRYFILLLAGLVILSCSPIRDVAEVRADALPDAGAAAGAGTTHNSAGVAVFGAATVTTNSTGALVLGGVTSSGVRASAIVPVSIPEAKRQVFLNRGYLQYSDFGATGDGETDDMPAIVAAHDYANDHGLAVRADEGATYYIGGRNLVAIIQTDTDFGTASFIIDDTDLEVIHDEVFEIRSRLEPFVPEGITSLRRNQANIGITLPGPALIEVRDNSVRRFIRFGLNQDLGSPQTDVFIVDADGNVDMDAPIIWDFDQISEILAVPIDEVTLTVTGGHFTTIANQAEPKYNYHHRGLGIKRSNVVVDGLEHHVVGEGEYGAPYRGFINVELAANVHVSNVLLTGRKTYSTIGSAGRPVSMGSYDINVYRANNVTFKNCRQTNDINDPTYWGIMGSNYSKNLVYDNCELSRFDAHMGVANATIRNSTLGHQGINAIGTGTFLLENSRVYGRSLINLRQDYGSTWEGELVIRNTVFVPFGGRTGSAVLIGGRNVGQHDFGYPTYMPRRIIIENLHIDDSNHPEGYGGAVIFADFNPDKTDERHHEPFPITVTEEVVLRNVTTASGKPLRVSDNEFMFRNVKIIRE
jgi:hypothetical protein